MGVAREFLGQGQRRGIHHMGAANFDDPVKLFGFDL